MTEPTLKRKDGRRRFDLGPLGVKVMRQRIAELEETIAGLEAITEPVQSINSGLVPTLAESKVTSAA
jgi:hypothetical protein